MSFLRVQDTKIVDGNGNEVIMRGAGLGGWMTMENFISGYPGCEFQIRDALTQTIGQEKADFFFDKFLEHFFAEDDAKFFRSLGLNCIRIAVGYRLFMDDLNPGILKPDAFKHLDRAISVCASQGIYTIIDMHTAPGGQSGGWHADAGTHIANFWIHRDFQDRLIWIWTEIAKRYKDNTWVAGYNVLNEPADPHPKHENLILFYDRAYKAIREVDGERHILFLDGNTFATDFTKFPEDVKERWANTAYAIHDYAVFGFPSSPEKYEGTKEQIERMRATYERKRKWMDERGLCVWNGEWGPVYARKEYDGEETEDIDKRRYRVLDDQLEIYKKDRLNWSIWLYKDIGFQGMVYVSRSTPYMELFKDFLLRKHWLAVDAWGKDDKHVKEVYAPIIDLIKQEIPEKNRKLYPPLWSVEERVTRLSRTMLVAEFLVQEWADKFVGLDEAQLEALAKSFSFENCEKREGLNHILRAHAND